MRQCANLHAEMGRPQSHLVWYTERLERGLKQGTSTSLMTSQTDCDTSVMAPYQCTTQLPIDETHLPWYAMTICNGRHINGTVTIVSGRQMSASIPPESRPLVHTMACLTARSMTVVNTLGTLLTAASS